MTVISGRGLWHQMPPTLLRFHFVNKLPANATDNAPRRMIDEPFGAS